MEMDLLSCGYKLVPGGKDESEAMKNEIDELKLQIETLEEEKRLYYVGCSRAKSYLHLSYPKFHYEKLGYFERKSKFLDY